MNPERTPVIVATGQVTERNEIVTAVELAARASEAALNAASGLRGRIQRVSLVSIVFSPASKRPASELVKRLGLAGVACETTSPGGNLPQWLVTRAAAEIAEGKLDATLIAGAEATRSMRAGDPNAHFMQGRQGLQATDSDGEADVAVGPSMDGLLTAAELGIRLYKPTTLYPLFENALAHKLGRTFDEQRASLGPLMSRFSEIASNHPFAWFKESLTADEISQVSDANRLVSEPYTKRRNAFPTSASRLEKRWWPSRP